MFSDLQAGDIAKLPADIEDHDILGGPKGQVSIRIIRPKGTSQALPVIMYFHGAGWVLGDKDAFDRLVREIANGANEQLFLLIRRTPPRLNTP